MRRIRNTGIIENRKQTKRNCVCTWFFFIEKLKILFQMMHCSGLEGEQTRPSAIWSRTFNWHWNPALPSLSIWWTSRPHLYRIEEERVNYFYLLIYLYHIYILIPNLGYSYLNIQKSWPGILSASLLQRPQLWKTHLKNSNLIHGYVILLFYFKLRSKILSWRILILVRKSCILSLD